MKISDDQLFEMRVVDLNTMTVSEPVILTKKQVIGLDGCVTVELPDGRIYQNIGYGWTLIRKGWFDVEETHTEEG